MNETAIQVENLGKQFRINHKRAGTFRELLHSRLNRVNGGKPEYVNAIDGLSFSISKGEAVGIIGPNGSGKSTLLRILSSITAPTAGRVEIQGRVASVLDLGTGFHPDLSGLENIYLSGTMMGMKRSEIKQKIDEIAAFSEIEKFLHTPVKHYSSGMYIRLAFSVIAHLEADILLLDEVLSVGDAAFQVKSYKKMQELLNSGKTILLVSHNLTSLSRYTTRCLYLENGKLAGEGRTDEIINTYAASIFAHKPAVLNSEKTGLANMRVWDDTATAPGNEFIRMRRIAVHNENRTTDEPIFVDEKIVIEVEFEKLDDTEPINIALRMNDVNGNPLFVASPILSWEEDSMKSLTSKGLKNLSCIIQKHLFNSSTFIIDLLIFNSRMTLLHFSSPYLLILKTDYKETNELFEIYNIDFYPIFPKIKWQKQ